MEHAHPQQLDEIVLGLGAREGYSGADLTNLPAAVVRDEVAWLGGAAPADPVLELRIHGVGGAPATENLESPAVLQTAGDADAGFFRAWYPGGSAVGAPRVEAYCWGGLNYQWRWSALWLLLLPFGLVNLAHWMLPDAANRLLANIARFVLRLLALALTVAFVATTAFVFLDLLAWQAAGRHRLWSWLKWFEAWPPERRLALGAVPVLGVIVLLAWLGVRSQGRYEEMNSGCRAPNEPGWPLSFGAFWRGKERLTHLRHAHLIACGATLAYVEAAPAVTAAQGWRTAVLWGCAAALAVAVVMVAVPWQVATTDPQGSRTGDLVGRALGYGVLAAAAALCVVRAWWPTTCAHYAVVPGVANDQSDPGCSATAIPHDITLQNVTALVPIGLSVVALLVVAMHRPWALHKDAMAKGFTAPVVAMLAALIGAIFGGCLIMTVGNVLGDPTLPFDAKQIAGARANDFAVPLVVYAAGLAFAVTIVCAVLVGAAGKVAGARIGRRLRSGDGAGSLSAVYAARGAASAGTQARKATARVWATSRLTDFAAAALLALVVPTAVTFVLDAALIAAGRAGGWPKSVARLGTTAGVFATVVFLLFLRSAFKNTADRKRFGFFWDVVTFWPRACHPFAPPSYGERSVPEVVTRIRRIVGDCPGTNGDPAVAQQTAERLAATSPATVRERHSPVLLVGYSQGAPIATAVVAQLPAEVRTRIALLTLASPVRRLYGRAFPAYYGTQQLETLRARLTDEATPPANARWRNAVRRSDYIGGWVLNALDSPPTSLPDVNREIYDPPVLWTDTDPAPPPTHLHSDWFMDPQTRPHAEELIEILTASRTARISDPARELGVT